MDEETTKPEEAEGEAQAGPTVAEAEAREETAQEAPGPSLADALAALEQRSTELAEARAAVAQRDAEMAGLRQQLADATSWYREALLAGAPEVPAELVSGATPEELAASVARAKQMVERIRGGVQAQQRVPAGSPVRTGPDFSSLAPQDKIAYALAQRR
ncbi:MAG: hypothetical protein HY680_05645 [Chloroflexi bacterium]|nr:hypothetical protein [Chloroflexota bacterium]